jgi:hypothetical protein
MVRWRQGLLTVVASILLLEPADGSSRLSCERLGWQSEHGSPNVCSNAIVADGQCAPPGESHALDLAIKLAIESFSSHHPTP